MEMSGNTEKYWYIYIIKYISWYCLLYCFYADLNLKHYNILSAICSYVIKSMSQCKTKSYIFFYANIFFFSILG